ncbi:hypothetical protein V8C26DRAFT_400601 [Trichoderma gracile]
MMLLITIMMWWASGTRVRGAISLGLRASGGCYFGRFVDGRQTLLQIFHSDGSDASFLLSHIPMEDKDTNGEEDGKNSRCEKKICLRTETKGERSIPPHLRAGCSSFSLEWRIRRA